MARKVLKTNKRLQRERDHYRDMVSRLEVEVGTLKALLEIERKGRWRRFVDAFKRNKPATQ